MPRANKNTLRQLLAQRCAERNFPLPADFGSLTVAGLKERIFALPPIDPPAGGSDVAAPADDNGKAHDAAELIRRAQAAYRVWQAQPRSPEGQVAYDKLSQVQRLASRLTGCTSRLVRGKTFDVEFHVKGRGWQSFASSKLTW